MWKNKRRFLLLGLLLSMILVGCSAEHNELMERKKVAVIMKSTESAFFKAVSAGANAAGTEYNMDILFEGPENEEDYETQNAMIKKAIEEKYDAIVFSAIDYNACKEAIEEADKAGVKVIGIDSDVNSKKVKCRIGTDNYEAGKMLGEELINVTDGEANVALISGEPGFSNLEERLEGLQDAVKDYPKIHLGDVQYDNYDGLTVMKMYYQNTEGADTIVFLEGTGGVTISSQFKQRDDQYEHILGFDAFYGVISGAIDGIIKQDTNMMGEQVVEEIANFIRNGEYSSKTVYTDTQWLTVENYHSILSDAELEYAPKWNSGGRTQ